MTAPFPQDEADRLAALHALGALDTAPEDVYDDITHLAAHICGVPIAAISLIDTDRQWFKSILGLAVQETPREVAFCAHTILQSDVLVVPDAQADPRFTDNPLVTGDPNVRFYAGAPLVTSDGFALGALCVIDRVPRSLTDEQRSALQVLARQVTSQLDLARRLAETERLVAEKERLIAERQRADEALLAEREFQRALLESLQEGIVACDAGGTLTLFNRTSREFHGLPEQPLPPEEWATHFDLYDADGLTPMRTEDIPLFRTLQGETVRGVEMVIAPKGDAPRRTLLAGGQPIFGPHGEKLGAVVAMHDITERRRAEQENARLASIVASSEDSIFAATLDGTIVSWNTGAERLYGYTAAEMIGNHASVLAQPHEAGLIQTVIKVLKGGGAVAPMETVRDRKDGSAVDVSLSFSPIKDTAGRVVGVSCIGRDITARKRAEADLIESRVRLQESEARLRRLTDAAFEGIAFSRDGVLVDVSPAFAAEFGYEDPAEMAGLPASALATPESQATILGRIAAGDEEPYEAILRRRDGTTFHAEVRGRQTSLDGRPARVTAVRDISERKAIEEERRAGHRALRQNEARLAEAQRIAKVGSWEYDPVEGEVTWSGEMFQLLGRDPEAGVPDFAGAMALYHPEDAPVLQSLVARAVQEGIGYELDLRGAPASRVGGPLRWYHTTGETVIDPAGRVVRLTGTLADITERKRLEEGLRESAERLREREASLRAVLESAPIILYAVDAEGMVTLSEGTGLSALGLTPGEAVGRSVFAFSGSAENEAYTRRALAGVAASFDTQVYGLCLHTELRPVQGADDSPAGFIGVCFDVTERVASEERFRVLFEQSSHAHVLFDEAGIIDCNAAALSMMRCPDRQDMLGMHPALLSPEFQPDGRRSDEKGAEMIALARERGAHRFEWQRRAFDGYEYPVEVAVTPVTLRGRSVLLSVWHDLTERKQQEERIKDHAVVLEYKMEELEEANAKLAALAVTDGLTGLKNHRAFQERLAEEVSRATRYGLPLSVVLLDVDHFKQYNDKFGHPAGDEVLRRVARTLHVCARETDLAARYGGEEFALILPQTDSVGAAVIAERIRHAIENGPWPERTVTASLGIAALTPGQDSGGLIACADRSLYHSKSAGRNRVSFTSA